MYYGSFTSFIYVFGETSGVHPSSIIDHIVHLGLLKYDIISMKHLGLLKYDIISMKHSIRYMTLSFVAINLTEKLMLENL